MARGQDWVLLTRPAQMVNLRGRGGVYVTRVSARNVVSLLSSLWEGGLQGTLTGQQVREDGESESSPVMGEIGVARKQHHPARKRADFRLVSRHART